LAAALATAPTLEVRGPSAATIRSFEKRQERAQRVLDELLARSGKAFPSLEDLERDPRVRRRLEIERKLDRSPSHYQLECLVKRLKPTLDRLAEFAEQSQQRALAPVSGRTTRPTLHYARPSYSESSHGGTPFQRRIFDLEFRLGRATTWEQALILVEDICELRGWVDDQRRSVKQQREATPLSGLELPPKREAAATFILSLLSRRACRWPEIETAGAAAGHSRKTLRNAHDELRKVKRVQRRGLAWELKTSDA
jgi:hypothetical protein